MSVPCSREIIDGLNFLFFDTGYSYNDGKPEMIHNTEEDPSFLFDVDVEGYDRFDKDSEWDVEALEKLKEVAGITSEMENTIEPVVAEITLPNFEYLCPYEGYILFKNGNKLIAHYDRDDGRFFNILHFFIVYKDTIPLLDILKGI